MPIQRSLNRLLVTGLLAGLAACNAEQPQTPAQAAPYLDAEAIYMALIAADPADPQRVTGRIQHLPAELGTFPWQLQLKARSEQEALAVEVTHVVACPDDAAPDCPVTQGAALMRGQRVFLHCEQALATPQPQLRACLLGTERLLEEADHNHVTPFAPH